MTLWASVAHGPSDLRVFAFGMRSTSRAITVTLLEHLSTDHHPSGSTWESRPTATSSSRPLRTAQITSSCLFLTPSFSCMR